MLLAMSADQDLFVETTAKLLDELVPVGELRRLRDDPVGFDRRLLAAGRRAGVDVAAGRARPTAAAPSVTTASSTWPWWPTSSAVMPLPDLWP